MLLERFTFNIFLNDTVLGAHGEVIFHPGKICMLQGRQHGNFPEELVIHLRLRSLQLTGRPGELEGPFACRLQILYQVDPVHAPFAQELQNPVFPFYHVSCIQFTHFFPFSSHSKIGSISTGIA